MVLVENAARKFLTAKKVAVRGVYQAFSKSEFTWRYIANLRPWLEYRGIREPLNDPHKNLLAELKYNGIIITSVQEIVGDALLFEELEAAVWRKELLLAEEINKSRVSVNTSGCNKGYVYTLLGPRPILDTQDIFVRFALQKEVVRFVNSYFGMLAKLRYFNVWHNMLTGQPPRESQLWHRDPEDRYVLKIFVYLTNVDEGSGALTYVPGTHPRGKVKGRPDSTLVREGNSYVRRTDDVQMSAVVPKERWITAGGRKGTLVFVDTRGYHKGGWARERDRIVYTCMFSSQASIYPEQFVRKSPLPLYSDRAVGFLLGA